MRKGFGNVLAEGVNRMSKKFGAHTDEFNVTVKGQELPMHDPRLKMFGHWVCGCTGGADHEMNVMIPISREVMDWTGLTLC